MGKRKKKRKWQRKQTRPTPPPEFRLATAWVAGIYALGLFALLVGNASRSPILVWLVLVGILTLLASSWILGERFTDQVILPVVNARRPGRPPWRTPRTKYASNREEAMGLLIYLVTGFPAFVVLNWGPLLLLAIVS